MTGPGTEFDAVIVGGGPAGLSAALWLARYRRRVRTYDAGAPRNEPTWAVHGFPAVPDLHPADLRRRLRDHALGAGAELVHGAVEDVRGTKDGFVIQGAGARVTARRILLAFGRRDLLPAIPGLERVYGTSVFHCPDCDGPSMAGAAVGVIGRGRPAAALALFLRTWTDRLVLLTHGRDPRLDDHTTATLERDGIPVRTEAIARILDRDGRLQRVLFTSGAELRLDGIFCSTGTRPATDLARRIGCRHDANGDVVTDHAQATSVPGIYAAGDIAGHPHLAVIAAAAGVRAALAIHRSLLPDEYHLS